MRPTRSLPLIVLLGLLTLGNSKSVNVNELFEEHQTSAQRIAAYGYPVEAHEVETPDGYILTLFRIPHSPKLHNEYDVDRPVVLLEHGLLSCSDAFILNGPNDALAYLLVDAGYDVWLGNARGNIYSRNNTKISVGSSDFWKFSWHEIGVIDVATTIDYILDETDEKALHYVGHSQGTTVFFVLTSMRPEYNEKIKTAQMLAPIAYLGNSTDFLLTRLAPTLGVPDLWSYLFGDKEFLVDNPFVQEIVSAICGGDSIFPKYCTNLFLLYGGSNANYNLTLVPLIAETHPAGISTNQMLHYLQEYKSNEFRQFDHGKNENIKVYGQATPLKYDLQKVTAPVYIYYGDSDRSANPADVSRVVGELPNVKLYHRVPMESWNHLDFIFGMDVKTYINDLVISSCNEYENK